MALELSQTEIDKFDERLALARIGYDTQSDFIYAPHINAIYLLAGEELFASVSGKLAAKQYEVMLPITMEVPKASGFTRPGSILTPQDRLVYQLLADRLAPVADTIIDRESVFSNVLTAVPNDFMFQPGNIGYGRYQEKIQREVEKGTYSHVLQADVASFFQNLNQHNLINLLHSAGCENELVKFLEKFLSFLTQKNSRGIIQGILPSDFLGNFYLCSIDGELGINGLLYARFVDDFCIFFESEIEARRYRILIAQWLRKEGLDLNEAKTKILPSASFLEEETEVERLFDSAKQEFRIDRIERSEFYHSTISWDFDPEEEMLAQEEQVLRATHALFDTDVLGATKDKIHKFCIPTFVAVGDPHGIAEVLRRYPSRPHLSQVYAKYIRKMIITEDINSSDVERLLTHEEMIFDYQFMWLYAALMSAATVSRVSIDTAVSQINSPKISEALRAVCAVFIGKFGDPAQKRWLRNFYDREPSTYVKAAILYAARSFPAPERDTCYRAWGGHSELNSLIVIAARKTPGLGSKIRT